MLRAPGCAPGAMSVAARHGRGALPATPAREARRDSVAGIAGTECGRPLHLHLPAVGSPAAPRQGYSTTPEAASGSAALGVLRRLLRTS